MKSKRSTPDCIYADFLNQIGSHEFRKKIFLMSHTVPLGTAWVVVPVPLFALIYGCFLPESPIYLSKVSTRGTKQCFLQIFISVLDCFEIFTKEKSFFRFWCVYRFGCRQKRRAQIIHALPRKNPWRRLCRIYRNLTVVQSSVFRWTESLFRPSASWFKERMGINSQNLGKASPASHK